MKSLISLLQSAPVKAFLTKENFEKLSTNDQRTLLQLLPPSDVCLADGNLVLARASALTNEYFNQACVDFKNRLQKGQIKDPLRDRGSFRSRSLDEGSSRSHSLTPESDSVASCSNKKPPVSESKTKNSVIPHLSRNNKNSSVPDLFRNKFRKEATVPVRDDNFPRKSASTDFRCVASTSVVGSASTSYRKSKWNNGSRKPFRSGRALKRRASVPDAPSLVTIIQPSSLPPPANCKGRASDNAGMDKKPSVSLSEEGRISAIDLLETAEVEQGKPVVEPSLPKLKLKLGRSALSSSSLSSSDEEIIVEQIIWENLPSSSKTITTVAKPPINLAATPLITQQRRSTNNFVDSHLSQPTVACSNKSTSGSNLLVKSSSLPSLKQAQNHSNNTNHTLSSTGSSPPLKLRIKLGTREKQPSVVLAVPNSESPSVPSSESPLVKNRKVICIESCISNNRVLGSRRNETVNSQRCLLTSHTYTYMKPFVLTTSTGSSLHNSCCSEQNHDTFQSTTRHRTFTGETDTDSTGFQDDSFVNIGGSRGLKRPTEAEHCTGNKCFVVEPPQPTLQGNNNGVVDFAANCMPIQLPRRNFRSRAARNSVDSQLPPPKLRSAAVRQKVVSPSDNNSFCSSNYEHVMALPVFGS